METEDIYNLAISPPIVSPFAAQWSQDNHMSVATEKGIHVFELIPSPMSSHPTIKFSRTFIYPPSTFPGEDLLTKIDSKVWNMEREEIYSFIMEESLTPKISDLAELVPKIVGLAWSPQNLIHPNKCLLAILSSPGTVMVLQKISMDWYPIHDMSSVRFNSKETEINRILHDNSNRSTVFSTMKSHIKQLQASTMTWSELFSDFAYLVVAYRNGDIVVYKLARILNFNEIPQPEIVSEINLNESDKINALHWVTVSKEEYLIVVGYFDGRVCGIRLKNLGPTVEIITIEKYYDYSDRIPISALQIVSQNQFGVKLLASKGSFILLLSFTANGTFESVRHLQVEGFAISGMTSLNAGQALITTENGTMFAIDTRENRFVKLEIKNFIPRTRVRYLGLAHSPSSVMFVNLTSPNTIYDHLIMKEPSKMYIFSITGEDWDLSSILKKNESGILEHVWDCLEVIRLKAAKAAEPAAVLPKLPSDLESLSLYELRIAMWTSVMTEVCEKKKVIQGIGSIAGEISEAQPLIFVRNACDYCKRLESKPSLTDEQELSLNLLRMYLEVYLAGEENEDVSPVSEQVKEVLNSSEFHAKRVEHCNLCGKAIDDLAWNVSKCPQGHMLPRCAITLLQVTTMDYKSCPICGLIFHPCLDEEYEETRCLFCDVPALKDDRIFGPGSHVSVEKSLSRRRTLASDVPENQEAETVGEEP